MKVLLPRLYLIQVWNTYLNEWRNLGTEFSTLRILAWNEQGSLQKFAKMYPGDRTQYLTVDVFNDCVRLRNSAGALWRAMPTKR